MNTTPEAEQLNKPPVDINQPGVLVHGIDTHSHEVLGDILRDGLKPRNTQVNPREVSYSLVPDYVSFSMVGPGGYLSTSTAMLWGANGRRFVTAVTLVIDPEYVRLHKEDFKAVGLALDPTKIAAKELYCDSNGELLNGIQYQKMSHIGAELFPDEVITGLVPPEAIIGAICASRQVDHLKKDLQEVAPNRKITVYDVEGNIYE